MFVTDVVARAGRVCGVRARGGAGEVVIRARLVVGADGRASTVAHLVHSPKPFSQVSGWVLWFGYYAGVPFVPDPVYETYFQGRSLFYVFPTTGGLHIVGGEFNVEEFPRLRMSDERAFLQALRGCPALAARVEDARLADGLYGLYRIESFMRQPAGPGWALAGDASFFKDPCTGQGMFDVFRGAQILADLIVGGARAGGPGAMAASYARSTRSFEMRPRGTGGRGPPWREAAPP